MMWFALSEYMSKSEILIKNMAKEITLVFAAHDMDVVFGLAHRVVVLYYGQFIADGTPEEIRVHPKVKEIYLGVK